MPLLHLQHVDAGDLPAALFHFLFPAEDHGGGGGGGHALAAGHAAAVTGQLADLQHFVGAAYEVHREALSFRVFAEGCHRVHVGVDRRVRSLDIPQGLVGLLGHALGRQVVAQRLGGLSLDLDQADPDKLLQ